jgi:hypothetical protein
MGHLMQAAGITLSTDDHDWHGCNRYDKSKHVSVISTVLVLDNKQARFSAQVIEVQKLKFKI